MAVMAPRRIGSAVAICALEFLAEDWSLHDCHRDVGSTRVACDTDPRTGDGQCRGAPLAQAYEAAPRPLSTRVALYAWTRPQMSRKHGLNGLHARGAPLP